jgi:hypothetical protein
MIKQSRTNDVLRAVNQRINIIEEGIREVSSELLEFSMPRRNVCCGVGTHLIFSYLTYLVLTIDRDLAFFIILFDRCNLFGDGH